MTRRLTYNPGRDPVTYLEAINCGENRKSILEQLLISLRGEKDRPNHQHHLIIGPRGSGKTHLLRILTAARIPSDPLLCDAYFPVIMPEETALRTPGDLLLKFVERLSEQLRNTVPGMEPETARKARTQCLSALTIAKAVKNPVERLSLMADTLESVGKTLDRILLPVAENLDQIFYLGALRSRKNPQDEQWALRRYFQSSSRLLLIGAAPAQFGAAADPEKAFYDFFRTHYLEELSNDEVLEIINLRLKFERDNPCPDLLRRERINSLINHFLEKSRQLRGLLVITGGLPRFTHLIYEVVVDTDVSRIFDTLNGFLDELTPYFQARLDPRVLPQAEIDLLHTLASAQGPLQPSEIADALYGVSSNEVSELLRRLQERGLVKRAGRPGGKAVTWDLTEPLYRVWTRFRFDPDGRDLYQMLAKFVALLFSLPDIDKERRFLEEKISSLPDGHMERDKFISRQRLIENAYIEMSGEKTALVTKIAVAAAPVDMERSIETKASNSFKALTQAVKTENMTNILSHLEKLRDLYTSHPDDDNIREQLAKGIVNSIYAAGNAGNLDQALSFLDDLRELNKSFPDDGNVREQFAKGLFKTYYDLIRRDDAAELRQPLLSELLGLTDGEAEEAIDKIIIMAVMTYVIRLIDLMKKENTPTLARKGIQWLEKQMPDHLLEFMHLMRLAVDVQEHGEEKALAREPEEVRRVVRMVLGQKHLPAP